MSTTQEPETPKVGARAVGYTPVRTGESSITKRTAKACLYCRRGKARCDGLTSWPCRRCRENGIECVFEGLSPETLKRRTSIKRDESVEHDQHSEAGENGGQSVLEVRLARLEAELQQVYAASRKNGDKIAHLETRTSRLETPPSSEGRATPGPRSASARATPPDPLKSPAFTTFAREAFELFWDMYAPLAPYIVPETDDFAAVSKRSPCLMHCIVAVASRHSPDKDLIEANRSEALRLMRETLYAETPATLDDLKALLVYNAWLGRGAPPGHTVTLALQLELPRCLERLLESISQPPDRAAQTFEDLMPAARVWLTLYAQDLWLSFATARRALVTIDLSITSARLLLHFSSLRPVDARLIAQSELVTILGVVQESFLKTQRHSAEHTVHIVEQANAHLEQWIATWSAWTKGQQEETGNFVLSSFSIMLQAARFYMNTLGLRDVTSAEELLPIHLPCLRTALDAAVRIQGIHRAHKIAHSAEMTLIVLSSCALFILKMVKLAPNVFLTAPSPSYPSFAALDASTLGQVNVAHLSPADPVQSASSPDTAASPLFVSIPSIGQALDAARHSAVLLECGPPDKQSYAQAVQAALKKLEGEMANEAAVPLSSNKRLLDNVDGVAGGTSKRACSAVEGAVPLWPQSQLADTPTALLTDPIGAWPSGPDPVALSTLSSAFDTAAEVDSGIAVGTSSTASTSARELDELTIASLIGTDSFWSWTSSLPGESIQPLL